MALHSLTVWGHRAHHAASSASPASRFLPKGIALMASRTWSRVPLTVALLAATTLVILLGREVRSLRADARRESERAQYMVEGSTSLGWSSRPSTAGAWSSGTLHRLAGGALRLRHQLRVLPGDLACVERYRQRGCEPWVERLRPVAERAGWRCGSTQPNMTSVSRHSCSQRPIQGPLTCSIGAADDRGGPQRFGGLSASGRPV